MPRTLLGSTSKTDHGRAGRKRGRDDEDDDNDDNDDDKREVDSSAVERREEGGERGQDGNVVCQA